MYLAPTVHVVKEGSSWRYSSTPVSLLVSEFYEKSKSIDCVAALSSKKLQNPNAFYIFDHHHHLLHSKAGAQLPLPVSLPAQISVPPPWRSLSLSQADLGVLFSNSSPFSYSQSLLLMPPPGASSKAGVQASFGPYSVTQVHLDNHNALFFFFTEYYFFACFLGHMMDHEKQL